MSRVLLFASGQSGAGKTTLGSKLKQQYGFVHFDGDTFSHGGDPTEFSGIPTAEMVATTDPALKQAYDECVKNAFNGMFEGRDVPLALWTPFVDMLIASIKSKWAANPTKSMVVTWSVYPKNLRDYIRSKLPDVQFVVLNDVNKGAVKRKAQQTIDAATARGQTLVEFLGGFGVRPEDATEDALMKRLGSFQRGFEPASGDEFGIDIDQNTTSDDVLAKVVSKFGLKREGPTD